MMPSSAKGKYPVVTLVTLSVRLVCVDLHVMVFMILYNHTFF